MKIGEKVSAEVYVADIDGVSRVNPPTCVNSSFRFK